MNKKQIVENSVVVAATAAMFIGTLAFSAFLFLQLNMVSFFISIFLSSLTGYSPSGMAAGGILFLRTVAVAATASLPFVSAWYTYQALSGESFFKKVPSLPWVNIPSLKDAQLAHQAMCAVSKEQHQAHKEIKILQSDSKPLCDSKALPLAIARLSALTTALKTNTSPHTFISLAEECRLSRECGTPMRKGASKA